MEHNRRKFIRSAAIAGFGLTLANTIPFYSFGGSIAAEPIIDIHQHANFNGRNQDKLLLHQKQMGVSTTILLPSGRPLSYGSTYYGVGNGLQAKAAGNEVCYQFAKQHPSAFLFAANEVPDFPDAVREIEKYLKLGAPVIGECKFNVECDSPEMQKIYKLAEAYQVPILMHWQFSMFSRGFERFHKMLSKYPKVNFIGHAQTWWANIDKDHLDQNILYPKGKVTSGGITDRLLSDYPNIYGDLSAGSGLSALTRDEDHARLFLKRHQDKLMFGSDCSDEFGVGEGCSGSQMIAAIKRLSETKDIERKLFYHNAKKLMRLDV